jgi:TRAP transporter 4TM/12TM fusion protein
MLQENARDKFLDYPIIIVGSIFTLFYIYEAVFGIFNTYSHRALYVLFTGVMIFLVYPGRRGSVRKVRLSPMDYVLLAAIIGCIGYWILSYVDRAVVRFGEPDQVDLVTNAIIILLCLEMARRVLGYVLPSIGLALMLYCYLGKYIPGYWGHKGFPLTRIIEFMGTQESIFGFAIHAYATYVFLFIVFSAFLEATGAGTYLIEFANAVAGRYKGGPAKVAVLSSAMIGSIMGSSVSNVATTGSFTIPMMKRKGYDPNVAGGIEAAASVGGQFMPPVMGAGAFLIAAITETRYVELIGMAAIPAVIYFFSVMVMVHLESIKAGVQTVSKDELPPLKQATIRGLLLLVPLAVIVYILIKGYSPNLAAIGGIAATICLGLIKKDLRISPKRFVLTLADGAKNSLIVGATGGVIGLIVGSVTLSGLAIKFSDAIISLTGGSLFLTILFVALTCYFIGMSMTVVADYLVVSVIAVPALTSLGVPIVAAHLMIFWLVNSSAITPPVCLCAFTAASISGGDPMKTGFNSLKLASALFITPFLFVYIPKLLYGNLLERLLFGALICVGFVLFGFVLEGFVFKFFMRLFKKDKQQSEIGVTE